MPLPARAALASASMPPSAAVLCCPVSLRRRTLQKRREKSARCVALSGRPPRASLEGMEKRDGSGTSSSCSGGGGSGVAVEASVLAWRWTLSLSRSSALTNSGSSASPSASTSASHQRALPAMACVTLSPTSRIRACSAATCALVCSSARLNASSSSGSATTTSSPPPPPSSTAAGAGSAPSAWSGSKRRTTASTAKTLPAEEKATTATEAPQSVDSSDAFLKSPLRRLEKVTCRRPLLSMRRISILCLPRLGLPRDLTIALLRGLLLLSVLLSASRSAPQNLDAVDALQCE
ncbi:hypothetical protein DAI22_06g167403 [Oryza sativa Japonica Group]|nr:hypothetical protein DAI22_06g167403 [Oryza sativa Japonica Group]